LQPVRGLSPESTGHRTQQIEVNGSGRRLIGRPGVEEVLQPACVALYRNKILAPDDAELLLAKFDIQCAGEDFRIHVAKTA
jgi:hypothetical protein